MDLVIKHAHLVTSQQVLDPTDVGIKDGKIAHIGPYSGPSQETISAKGLHLLPGPIDPQVHFREPGFPKKETIHHGTKAAILGGVTAVFEMPNTKPPTTSEEAIADKFGRIPNNAWCDFGAFVGATPENAEELGRLEALPGVVGVKIFMGSSTGNLLVADDKNVLNVLKHGKRRVAVHSEDEERLIERKKLITEDGGVHQHPQWRDVEVALRATKRLIKLAREANRPVQVLHITTADEIAFLREHKDIATVEVPPQHLTLCAPECYDRLGTLAQMNPPIRTREHQEGLWQGIADGTVDCIGSDHAPHTLEEKHKPYPNSPSGMPGVQTILPLMLHHHNAGRLSLPRLVQLMCENPARAYGAMGRGKLEVGSVGSVTLVDLNRRHTMTNSQIASVCGWTPFDGMSFHGWPIATIVRGHLVMREGEVLGSPAGQVVEFGSN